LANTKYEPTAGVLIKLLRTVGEYEGDIVILVDGNIMSMNSTLSNIPELRGKLDRIEIVDANTLLPSESVSKEYNYFKRQW
jgi:hypothetical protein